MKKAVGIFMILSLLLVSASFAAERGTPAEAEALVKKAIAYIKANGKDKAFAEFSNPKGQFVDRDLYIFTYDMSGKCVAHGQNVKMVGKDLIDLTDADGKLIVKEKIDLAKAKGKGWIDNKFTNPITKKVEAKTTYNERYEDIVVGSGAYK